MNLRNQADQSLDKALEEYLEKLFVAYFHDGDAAELGRQLQRIESTYKKANKMLDEL